MIYINFDLKIFFVKIVVIFVIKKILNLVGSTEKFDVWKYKKCFIMIKNSFDSNFIKHF